MRIVTLHALEESSSLTSTSGLPPFDSSQIAEHGADLHLCAMTAARQIAARCSVWWRQAPPFENYKVGVIGHYSSADDEAAADLIEAAANALREQGCTLAIGPMDGNTWRHFRFVTEAGSEPPFFLEPANPPEWPLQFERAGFVPMAQWFSALNSDLSQTDERVSGVAERIDRAGVRIRSAQAADMPRELRRIYRMSRVAFAHNLLYSELPEDAFVAQYSKIVPHMRPELVLLAERGDELVGFLFGMPDLAQAARGVPVDTFLLKTGAVLPEWRSSGLASLVTAHLQDIGRQMGFRRCIHVTMIESNASRKISQRYATTMRRYTLFRRDLQP